MSPALQPGLCSVTFRRLDPTAIIDLAAAAGIAGIEWGGDIHVPPGDPARATALAAATRAAGLSVSSYGSYLRPPTDGLDGFRRTAETALALGAPMIRIWPGARDKPSVSYTAEERAEVTRAIAEIGGEAADQGVAVGLEYHPGTLTDELGSATRLIRDIDCDAVHLYWQPRPGLQRAEGQREIRTLGNHVAHLHVFQWNSARDRFPLSDGADTWLAYFGTLGASRWQSPRFAMIEFVRDDDPAQFREDAECLSRLLDDRP